VPASAFVLLPKRTKELVGVGVPNSSGILGDVYLGLYNFLFLFIV
jgi:hypothetical protein